MNVLTAVRASAVLVVSTWLVGTAAGQTVTVSAGGGAMETSIQVAIDSLAPGGSRDDGNKLNNVVQILDDSVYAEALSIVNMGLTLEGTGSSRPTIVTTHTQSLANTGNTAIRIDADEPVTLRGLILLPDAAEPPETALIMDEMTNSSGYSLLLEDVLVTANAGGNVPTSTDGRTAPGPGAVRYTGNVMVFNSPPTGFPTAIEMNRVVLTGASSTGLSLIRMFSDNGEVTFGPGFTMSFSGGHGLITVTATDNVFRWLGTPSEPILLHGNAWAAISNETASTRGTAEMRHVAVTGNSTGGSWVPVWDAYNGGTPSEWEHVTIAGNSTREGSPPGDAAVRSASPVHAENCIFAGDGMETVRSSANLLRFDGVGNYLRGNGIVVDISQGATSLNRMYDEALALPVDGLLEGELQTLLAGVRHDSPGFLSLDPADANYLVVTNKRYAGAGPSGADLVGAGSLQAVAFEGMLSQSGNLQTYIESIVVPTAASSDKFVQPTADELMIFREALDDMLSYRFQSASDRLALVNYDLIIHSDTAQGGRRYALVQERGSNQKWGGFFAFDLKPRRELVMQSPHPLFDGTRLQAIDLFFRTESLGFLQSGTHRNNSPILSTCDGTFTNGDPYHISDMAHNDKSFYQVFHEQAHRRFPTTRAVSVHGMATTTDPSDVVISNGTAGDVVGYSLSKDIASTMNVILTAASDSRYAVSHQEPGEFPALSGGTNTQGRFCNGSHNACNASVPALFPERFIHMEQAPSVRTPGDPSIWDFVVDTYNSLIGDFAPWSVPPMGDGTPVFAYEMDGDLVPAVGVGDGVLVGSAAPVADRFGAPDSAIEFSSAGHGIIPEVEYSQDDREFSLLFWFRATASANDFQYLYSHGGIGRTGQVILPNVIHVYLQSSTGFPRMRFTTGNGSHFGYDGNVALNDGDWHLFTLTYSTAGGATVYIDGVEAASEPGIGGEIFAPEGPVFVGARTDLGAGRFLAEGPGVSGAMDQLQILNSALTAQEVLDIYNQEGASSMSDWRVF